MLIGNENWLAYVVAILSGKILLLISMQATKPHLFRQLYFGYALVILAMVFGKILVSDTRWFIEIITRFALVFGHLLFVSGLANIKLIPLNQNPFGYQTVNE